MIDPGPVHAGTGEALTVTAEARMKVVVPLAILLAAAACDEVDEFSTDCTNPFSLDGAWEGHEGASDDGVWWRFDLEEQPIQRGAVRLNGSYVTDFLYHLEGIQGADTVGGNVQGGMLCLTLGGGSMPSEMGLRFEIEYPDGQDTEHCDFTAAVWRQGLEEYVNGVLTCAGRGRGLRLHRARR